jgi:O-antigen ligase
VACAPAGGGVGLGGFAEHYTQFKTVLGEEVKEVHNDYLQLLSEMGFLGALFILFFLAFFIRRYLWVLKRLK